MSDRGFINTARQLLEDDQIGALVEIYQTAPQRLEEIKQNAQGPDAEAAREAFADLSDERQTEIVDKTISDLAVTFNQLRTDPTEGIERLQSELRDPYTVEALLLLFENEDHIDEEYSDDVKEFVRWRFKLLGVNAIPEAYTEEEKREIIDRFGLDYRPEAAEGTNN